MSAPVGVPVHMFCAQRKTPRGLSHAGPQGKYHASQAHYVLSQLLGSIQFNGCKIDSQPVSHHCDTARESGTRASLAIESPPLSGQMAKLHQRRALHAPQASFIVRGCHGHGRIRAGCRSACKGAPAALRAAGSDLHLDWLLYRRECRRRLPSAQPFRQ